MKSSTISHSLLALVALSPLAPVISVRTAHAGAATQPSLAVDSTEISAMRSMLARLVNDDPAVRDEAQQRLMGMDPSELPLLRQAIQSGVPLRPGEGVVLQEIVDHVFLSADSDIGDPKTGFMGIEMLLHEAIYSELDDDAELPAGVFVDQRLPGFPSYRMLRNGDLIVALSSPDLPYDPPEPGDKQIEHRVRSASDIMELVQRLSPGSQVNLTVLRSGHRLEISFKLGSKPAELSETGIGYQKYRELQQKKADEYWQDNFAGMVDGSNL